MHLGVRHGWFWSAVIGAVIGYSTRGSGIELRKALIGWLILAVSISAARFLNFVFDEPGWWASQIERKGIATVAWNTFGALVWFAVFYGIILAAAGFMGYFVAGIGTKG